MKEFVSKHSVRLAALLAALIPLLVAQWPGVPWEALVPVVAAVLGLGEIAQRHQDDKTTAALFEVPPTD
jgi:phosphate/sulfate permease